MVVNEGSVATLTVYVEGNPHPDVYWRKGRRDIDTRRGKYAIIDGSTLQVNKKVDLIRRPQIKRSDLILSPEMKNGLGIPPRARGKDK